MKMKRLFLFLFALSVASLVFCCGLLAVPYALPSARVTTWIPGVDVGVPGGIPSRTHIIDVTQSPYFAPNDDSADASLIIASAISAASSGDVVYMPPGTYRWDHIIGMASNVTLRGAGLGEPGETGLTTLDVRSLQCISFGGDPSFSTGANSTVTAGLTQDSTVITLASASGFSSGKLCRITLPNDTSATFPTFSVWNQPGVRFFDILITNVSGNNLTIRPKIYGDFSSYSGVTIQQQGAPAAITTGVGIESLVVDGANGTMTDGINLNGLVKDSWIKNVKEPPPRP